MNLNKERPNSTLIKYEGKDKLFGFLANSSLKPIKESSFSYSESPPKVENEIPMTPTLNNSLKSENDEKLEKNKNNQNSVVN